MEGNHTLPADQVLHAGLLGPAVGFVGFELELRDRFDGITGDREFGVLCAKLVGDAGGAGQRAVGFFVEAGGDRLYRGGQEGVVIGDGEGQAALNCRKLGKHKRW